MGRVKYYEDNRIASIVSYSDKEEVLSSSSFSYTYDRVGNKLSMTDENGGVTTYRYDSLYRVISVDYPSVAGTGTNGMKNHGSTRGKGKRRAIIRTIRAQDTLHWSAMPTIRWATG